MNISELTALCLAVLKDWRVIVITIAMILFVALANYVVKYKKRAPRIKTKAKKIAPPPTEQKTDEKQNSSEEANLSESQENSGSK